MRMWQSLKQRKFSWLSASAFLLLYVLHPFIKKSVTLTPKNLHQYLQCKFHPHLYKKKNSTNISIHIDHNCKQCSFFNIISTCQYMCTNIVIREYPRFFILRSQMITWLSSSLPCCWPRANQCPPCTPVEDLLVLTSCLEQGIPHQVLDLQHIPHTYVSQNMVMYQKVIPWAYNSIFFN